MHLTGEGEKMKKLNLVRGFVEIIGWLAIVAIVAGTVMMAVDDNDQPPENWPEGAFPGD